jgi:N utilization substance protein B
MPIKRETRSRALALQLLYAWDVGGASESLLTCWHRVLSEHPAGPRTQERALELAEGVVRQLAAHDERIAAAADRWRSERLAVIDRNILRLGVHELVEGVTPPKVVIDEGVRLGKWFGGDKTPGFVNGVLDRVARDLGKL